MSEISFDNPTTVRTEKRYGPWEQRVWRFPNGFGASVVRGKYTYGGERGLWELAVLEFPNIESESYDLTYSTSVTSDVVGYLTEDQVAEYLKRIASLDSLGMEPKKARLAVEVIPVYEEEQCLHECIHCGEQWENPE